MHIFINSKKYPATIMKKFIGSAQYKELSVNPFDPNNVFRSLHLSDIKVLNVNVSFIVYIPSQNEVQLRGFQILH